MREQRLIDANALIDRIQHSYFPSEIVSITTVTGCFLEDIVSPTIYPESITHSHWKDFHVTNDGVAEELCGKCEEWTIGKNKCYCPNCGARMDEVE